MYASGLHLILRGMNGNDLSQLNTLVGAALRGLVEAGASAEAIGAFAASYRQEVAQVLGLSDAPSAIPDLQVLVTEAVGQALADAGIGGRRRTKKPVAQKFYVWVAGKKTSVTIGRATVDRLLETQGSEDNARRFVQQLADNAPLDVDNRSKWVEGRILASLNFTAKDAEVRGLARH